jgi:hypothetical protein
VLSSAKVKLDCSRLVSIGFDRTSVEESPNRSIPVETRGPVSTGFDPYSLAR